MNIFRKLRDRKGQGALEYALILAIVLAVVVIGMKTGFFQGAVNTVKTFLNTQVSNATT
jgi:Flp pilus assembly pilin Flp